VNSQSGGLPDWLEAGCDYQDRIVYTGQLPVKRLSGNHAEVIFRQTAPGNVVMKPGATAWIKHYP